MEISHQDLKEIYSTAFRRGEDQTLARLCDFKNHAVEFRVLRDLPVQCLTDDAAFANAIQHAKTTMFDEFVQHRHNHDDRGIFHFTTEYPDDATADKLLRDFFVRADGKCVLGGYIVPREDVLKLLKEHPYRVSLTVIFDSDYPVVER